jgi:drug/metabolite transporter (DMT)-like permease
VVRILESRAPSFVFASLCFVWGSTWLVIKIGLEFLPPFLFAGIRFATATIMLLMLTKLLHARMPRDRHSWAIMLFLGVFQISLPYGLVFWGEEYISSGLSAVLFATLPFFVVITAHILVKDEKLTRLKAIGVIASFAGLVAIFWRDIATAQTISTQYSFFGSLAVVGSSASGGMANVVAKRYAGKIDPAANVLVQSIVGTVVLSSVGILTERNSLLNFTPTAVFSVLYLGIIGSALAFVGLYWLLTKASATNVSLFTFITPIIALGLGWLLLREVLDPNLGLGTVLILIGVYLTLRPIGGTE